jgi:N6-adenosine-specific RNA methylase IME4
MTALTRYEAARAALEAAVRVDEVMEMHLPAAAAMKAYAIQAGDREMEANAAEYRQRAERKLGELLAAQKETFGLAKGGRPAKPIPGAEQVSEAPITLADLGIDRKLSSRAQKKAGIAAEAFDLMVGRMREDIVSGRRGADVLKDVSTEQKQQRRDNRERVLGALQHALPTRQYGVILADPEWRFEPWSRATGLDRSADNHYPTSCTEVIAARDVPSIAARDCVLFLYATAPMLPHALLVMSAWGFDYRSHVVWDKIRASGARARGTGYWFINCHELLLVGVKGNIPAPAPGTQEQSILQGIIGAHSAKPDTFLEMIERYFPTLPKIELNRRGPARPGWDAWGNEAREHDARVTAPSPPHEDPLVNQPVEDLPRFLPERWRMGLV